MAPALQGTALNGMRSTAHTSGNKEIAKGAAVLQLSSQESLDQDKSSLSPGVCSNP